MMEQPPRLDQRGSTCLTLPSWLASQSTDPNLQCFLKQIPESAVTLLLADLPQAKHPP